MTILCLLTRNLHARRRATKATRLELRHGNGSQGEAAIHQARPKHHRAAEIARAVFENNREALDKAFAKAALPGKAYAFKALADRAYGKLRETHQVEISTYRDVSEEDAQKPRLSNT